MTNPDLLLAFAILIIKLRDTNKDPEHEGIAIVLGNTDGSGDWGDYRKVGDVAARIVPLVRGLDKTLDQKAADDLVFKWFKIRRIGKPYGDAGPNSIHTKTVCIDKQLLYVGSDNIYPSYNEEHGIWIDEKLALADWVDNYWNVVWSNSSTAVKDDFKVSDFPTDIV